MFMQSTPEWVRLCWSQTTSIPTGPSDPQMSPEPPLLSNWTQWSELQVEFENWEKADPIVLRVAVEALLIASVTTMVIGYLLAFRLCHRSAVTLSLQRPMKIATKSLKLVFPWIASSDHFSPSESEPMSRLRKLFCLIFFSQISSISFWLPVLKTQKSFWSDEFFLGFPPCQAHLCAMVLITERFTKYIQHLPAFLDKFKFRHLTELIVINAVWLSQAITMRLLLK